MLYFSWKGITRQTKILCNVFIDMIIIAWCILIPVRKADKQILAGGLKKLQNYTQ